MCKVSLPYSWIWSNGHCSRDFIEDREFGWLTKDCQVLGRVWQGQANIGINHELALIVDYTSVVLQAWVYSHQSGLARALFIIKCIVAIWIKESKDVRCCIASYANSKYRLQSQWVLLQCWLLDLRQRRLRGFPEVEGGCSSFPPTTQMGDLHIFSSCRRKLQTILRMCPIKIRELQAYLSQQAFQL